MVLAQESYTYSLLPVMSVALLLCFEFAFRSGRVRTMALYCASIAIWASILFASQVPHLAYIQIQLSAFGCLVSATYVHAMFDLMEWKGIRRRTIWIAYLSAMAITLLTSLTRDTIGDQFSLQSGPWSLPAMALAGLLLLLPLDAIGHANHLSDQQKQECSTLIMAGMLAFIGGWGTILLLSMGQPVPYGMLMMLGALLLIGHVLHRQKTLYERRIREKSYFYMTLAALVSAVFLFGVMWFLSGALQPHSSEYYVGLLFMLFMVTLAFEPLRQLLLSRLGATLLKHRTSEHDLAKGYAEQEQRADQAERLAELGTFVSAVAHEVRNPLGVLSAHMTLLKRKGVDEATLQTMQEQIRRASHFIDDLLTYGRPRPLEIRQIELDSLLALACSTAKAGLRDTPPPIDFSHKQEQSHTIEADQSQLMQVFVILFENALLALRETESPTLQITSTQTDEGLSIDVKDNGPGLPEGWEEKAFQPFVTSRKRDQSQMSTGLGLAIAKRIVERHNGRLWTTRPPDGGAQFSLWLPLRQPLLGVATESKEGAPTI